jgi:hypothetical protein
VRNLTYVVVEIGKCANCHRDAGTHSIEGLCGPQAGAHQRHRDVPEPCYVGRRVYAFVDQDNRYADVESMVAVA